MDSLRGKFGISGDADDGAGWDDVDDDNELSVDDAPPGPVGQDERRMQVRAYNYWASLLGERSFPSVEDIEPDSLPDFAENSVLLDFTAGTEDPAIAFLGNRLAGECGSDGPIQTLADVPARSLLSRITDHYLQIIANEAPIGFEAEFINQNGLTILYRGILLPFSTDDETIDFIYGVINWKEVADQLTTDELLLEIDQALEGKSEDQDTDEEPVPTARQRAVVTPSITRWADGPCSAGPVDNRSEGVLPDSSFAQLDAHLAGSHDPVEDRSPADSDDGFEDDGDEWGGTNGFDPLAAMRRADRAPGPDSETAAETPPQAVSDLLGCLAEAQALAREAQDAEVRSRSALYRAVGRAYDVSLAAQDDPQGFAELLEDEGIASVERAPMTPVVKLVFGADYDKSRLAEYAAVLSYAARENIAAGDLAQVLESTEGGLKALVGRERRFRKTGEAAPAQPAIARTWRKLGKLEGRPLAAIPAEGAPYALCLIRRDEAGEIAFLGEVAEDSRLLARAAKQLVG